MTGALTNHLSQSTVFAVAAGLVALALRKNRAEIRYWLWLCASLKFLLPFSFLVSLGSRFEWAPAARKIATEAVSFTVVQITEPFPATISVVPSIPRATDWLLISLLGIWLCGFLVILVQLFRGWLHIRAAVRFSTSLKTGMAVDVRTCPGLLEPGVVGLDVAGLSNPVVLLPAGILERLTQPQLEAVLAHELSHVRRRDNLTAALHMIVEAVFWFHPLVWWIGARLVEERERACDEDVLRLGNEPKVYAESILRVCEFYVESPLACVSGVTGSDLKKRIQWIMKSRFGVALSTEKKLLLATAGVVALAVPIVAGILTSPRLLAQTTASPSGLISPTADRPSFEVVSVKLNKSADPPNSNFPIGPGAVMQPVGGLFSTTNVRLRNIIAFAYKMTPDQTQYLLPGLPSWVDSEHFDIEAKADGSPTKDEFRLRVQSLLADRFRMSMHHQTRQLPVFALVLSKPGKTGSSLIPHTDDTACLPNGQPITGDTGTKLPPLPCGGFFGLMPSEAGRLRYGARKVTLEALASVLSGFQNLDRPGLDRTGLTGTFDISFEFQPEGQNPGQPQIGTGSTPYPSGPSLQEALQEQLGLKLVPQTGPVDVLIIDHIEQPSSNADAFPTPAASAPQASANQSPISATDRLTFDVASIKRNNSGSGFMGGPPNQPGGRYSETNLPLKQIILIAYQHAPGGLEPHRLIVGPEWTRLLAEHFDIDAKAEGNLSRDKLPLLLQSLLADRFKLVIHHETRQLPIYALVVAKSGKMGPQLTPHSADAKCLDRDASAQTSQPAPGSPLLGFCEGFSMMARIPSLREAGNKITMDMLAGRLSTFADRQVVDRTGLSGTYDVSLEFAVELNPDSPAGMMGLVAADETIRDPSGPPSLVAALQDQLGLKLVPQTGPADVIVIDHVEEPSPN